MASTNARAIFPMTASAVSHTRNATTIQLRGPYLLFLGEADHDQRAKTAFGLRDWASQSCLGQLRMPACKVTLGLTEMNPAQAATAGAASLVIGRSEEHTSELQSLMRISYAVFCLKKKKKN